MKAASATPRRVRADAFPGLLGRGLIEGTMLSGR